MPRNRCTVHIAFTLRCPSTQLFPIGNTQAFVVNRDKRGPQILQFTHGGAVIISQAIMGIVLLVEICVVFQDDDAMLGASVDSTSRC